MESRRRMVIFSDYHEKARHVMAVAGEGTSLIS